MLTENKVRPEERTEKAGVGGSTPSLATMFSITYMDFIKRYIVLSGLISWAEQSDNLHHLFWFL